MVEIMCSFDVCLSVCLSVCLCVMCAHSGAVNQTSLKWLKLRTSNWRACSHGQSRHDPLKFFKKGVWPAGSLDSLNFWALNANSSKTRLKLRTSNLTCMSRDIWLWPRWLWPLKIFRKGSVCKNSLVGGMHSHERLIVLHVTTALKSEKNTESICRYVDYLLVMAYNYHGSWNKFTGHHSGLFARSDEVAGEREWNQVTHNLSLLVRPVTVSFRKTVVRAKYTRFLKS